MACPSFAVLGHDADFRPKTDGARRGRKYTDSTGQRSRLVPAFPCRLPGTVRWRVRLPIGPGGTELYRVGQNALATGAAQVSFRFPQPPARHMTYGRDLSGPAVWAEQCVRRPGAGSVCWGGKAGRSEQAAELLCSPSPLSRRENSSPFGLFQAHNPGQAHILGSGRLCPSGSF